VGSRGGGGKNNLSLFLSVFKIARGFWIWSGADSSRLQDKNGISAGGRTADNFRYDEGRGAVVGDAEGGFDDPVFHGVQDFSRLELV